MTLTEDPSNPVPYPDAPGGLPPPWGGDRHPGHLQLPRPLTGRHCQVHYLHRPQRPRGRRANGNAPIAGATVTLLSSDSLTGTFTAVPDSSAVMSPGNRANPDTSHADGSFGWDTVPGFYEVEASKPGCGSTTSPPFQAPPPMTSLQLVLHCASGAATGVTTT